MSYAKTKTLLDKAREIRTPQCSDPRFSDEEVELALAWVSGEVSLTQVSRVRGVTTASASYSFLACALRQWMNEKEK